MGDFVVTNFRATASHLRRGTARAGVAFGRSEAPARFSVLSGVAAVLVAVILLVVLARAAFLDGLAVLARPKPALAGIMIGALGDLRLLRHFDLRW